MLSKALLCTVCGGFGSEEGCPACGVKSGEIVFDKKKDEDHFLSISELVQIPSEYMQIVWNFDELLRSKTQLKDDLSFVNYASSLSKLHGLFVDGKLSSKSGIIVSPAGYSKTVFAYSCMQFALKAGFKIAPILDTLEIRRLLMLCAINPKYRLYNRIDYDNYMTCHVLFAKVTLTEEKNYALATIRELMDRRSRMGLPTYILSESSLEQISAGSSGFSFLSNMSFSASHPVIIQYFGG